MYTNSCFTLILQKSNRSQWSAEPRNILRGCQRPSHILQACLDVIQWLGYMHFDPSQAPWQSLTHPLGLLEHHSFFAHEPCSALLSSQQPSTSAKFAENEILEKNSDCKTLKKIMIILLISFSIIEGHLGKSQFLELKSYHLLLLLHLWWNLNQDT